MHTVEFERERERAKRDCFDILNINVNLHCRVLCYGTFLFFSFVSVPLSVKCWPKNPIENSKPFLDRRRENREKSLVHTHIPKGKECGNTFNDNSMHCMDLWHLAQETAYNRMCVCNSFDNRFSFSFE